MHPCQYFTHLCIQQSAEAFQFLTIRYFNSFGFFWDTLYFVGHLVCRKSYHLVDMIKSPFDMIEITRYVKFYHRKA
jgi:hypothetical protein